MTVTFTPSLSVGEKPSNMQPTAGSVPTSGDQGSHPIGLGALAQREQGYFRNNSAVAGMTFKAALTVSLEDHGAQFADGLSPGPIRFELYRSPQGGSWVAMSKELGAIRLDSVAPAGDLAAVKAALTRSLGARIAVP